VLATAVLVRRTGSTSRSRAADVMDCWRDSGLLRQPAGRAGPCRRR
jgi:hypothetical protein